jgi:hypothetical protein
VTDLASVSSAPEAIDVHLDHLLVSDVDDSCPCFEETPVVASQRLVLLLLDSLQVYQARRLVPVPMERAREDLREGFPGVNAVPGKLLEPLEGSISLLENPLFSYAFIATGVKSVSTSAHTHAF